MVRTIIAEALKRSDFGAEVLVKGWVRTRRGNKTVSFIALNDGSCIHNIQVVVDKARQSKFMPRPSKFTVLPILKVIRFRKKAIPSSFYARLLTCVRVPTLSGPCSVCATTWPWLFTAFSTNADFSISTRLFSRLPTAKVPDKCSR